MCKLRQQGVSFENNAGKADLGAINGLAQSRHHITHHRGEL